MAIDYGDAIDMMMDTDMWINVALVGVGVASSVVLQNVVERSTNKRPPAATYGVLVVGGAGALGRTNTALGGGLFALYQLGESQGFNATLRDIGSGSQTSTQGA